MRMIVIVDRQEAEGLAYLAREELRDLPKQLRYVLRMELARRGLWGSDRPVSQRCEREEFGD